MNSDYKKHWIYNSVQTLQLEGGQIQISLVEVEISDFDRVSLRIEVTGGDLEVINKLFDFQDIIRGSKINCNFDGTLSRATLELIHKQEFSLTPGVEVFYVLCSDVEAVLSENPETYEFFLPYVKFGVADRSTSLESAAGLGPVMRDHCTFTVNGRLWKLRHAYEIQGAFHNALDIMKKIRDSGVNKKLPSDSIHSFLEVDSNNLTATEAEKTATEICRLLQLAFGQTVGWAKQCSRNASGTKFLCKRAHTIPSKNSAASPIRNWCDGKIQRYIENAFPIYTQNPEWWSITLSWVALTFELRAVESSLAINYILFDRISTFQLEGHSFGNLLGNAFAEKLNCKCDRRDLAKSLEKVLVEFSKDYPVSKTSAIIQKLQEWNKQPPYAQKINTTYERNNLPSPPAEILQLRHSLLHTGNVKSSSCEALNTYHLCNQQLLLLLFSMLGYTGNFFAAGTGKQELPIIQP